MLSQLLLEACVDVKFDTLLDIINGFSGGCNAVHLASFLSEVDAGYFALGALFDEDIQQITEFLVRDGVLFDGFVAT